METAMPMFYGFDPLYLIVALVAGGLSAIAQAMVSKAYSKYSRVGNSRNLSGAEAADIMLKAEGVANVTIRRQSAGMLTDNYDPREKVINLSPDVFDGRSIAAVGVACHEAGHALQDAHNYGPMALRSLLVIPTNLGSRLAIPLICVGLVLNSLGLVKVGIIMFGLVLLFQLVTLPVELNASSRSKQALVDNGIVVGEEARGVSAVLNAAALTYIAAAVGSLLTLLYFLLRSGLLGGNRRD